MTPEGEIKEKVKKLLVEHGAYFFMPVQTGYGKRTLDFLCCMRGQFFAVETKRAKEKLTALQNAIAREMMDAGGLVFAVHDEETLAYLSKFLNDYTNRVFR